MTKRIEKIRHRPLEFCTASDDVYREFHNGLGSIAEIYKSQILAKLPSGVHTLVYPSLRSALPPTGQRVLITVEKSARKILVHSVDRMPGFEQAPPQAYPWLKYRKVVLFVVELVFVIVLFVLGLISGLAPYS